MDETRRQKFITTYGFDPMSIPKPVTPKQGAVGGTPSFTKEQMDTLMGTSKSPVSFTKDQVDFIDSNGGINAFRGSVNKSETVSDYKPGKFVQSLEDFRPDYSGGILKDISEGLGDVGVGVLKAGVRMPVNILQALTPDKMWGENSLLNSDSERAQAFASATKGKTGLQKLGATGVDIASLVNPFSAEATVSGLAAKNAGRLAKLATRGIDVAAENPSLLQKGAGLFQKVVPSIVDSVVSGAIVGKGGDSVGTDTLIGAAFPTAKFAYREIADIAGKPFAKNMIAAIKDYTTGGTVAQDRVAAELTSHLKTLGKDGIQNEAKQMVKNRSLFSKVLQTFKGNWFGYGSKADNAFNEASDLMSQRYMPHAEIVDGSLDLTKSHDILQADKLQQGQMLADSKKLFAGAKVKPRTIKQSFMTTMQNAGMNKTTDAYKSIENYVMKRIDDLAEANGGYLTANDIDGIRHDLGVQMGKLDDTTEGTLLGMYKQAYKVFASNVEKAGINAGQKEAVNLYRNANKRYSTLLDTEAMMRKISRTKSNPLGLTQQQRHGIQLLAGSIGGFGTMNPMTGGVTYFASIPLTKMLSDVIAKGKIYAMKADPVMNALKNIENETVQKEASSLKDLIAKQSKK